MGNALAFDTYAYVKKLRDAGLTEQQAAIQAEALVSLIEERLATKKDLAAVDADLKRAIKELDVKIEATKAELKRDIKELDAKIEATKAELKRDIKDLDVKIEETKAELKRDIATMDERLKRDSREMEYRLVIKLGGLTMAAVGLLITILRLWPIPTLYAPPPGHEMRGSTPNSGER